MEREVSDLNKSLISNIGQFFLKTSNGNHGKYVEIE